MHAGSSELLLDAKCRQLLHDELMEQEQRRRKLLELGYNAAKRRPPRRTCKQRLTFYATSSLALVAISGGCALLFLVPLYVDPAISTLSADFFPEPVICTTFKREDLWGLFNCSWSSCREGCTSEVYRCTHIYVTYTPWSNSSLNESDYGTDFSDGFSARKNSLTMPTGMEEPEVIEAVLLVNIKGCGYPPVVDCENFTRELGYEGSRFPCYYSRVNGSIVMADYDRDAEVTIIMHYFAAPLVMTLATTAVLCVMHCDCRCQPPPRRYPPSRRAIRSSRPNDLRYWWLCFYVGECKIKAGFRVVSQD
jgi:hypothetical protein